MNFDGIEVNNFIMQLDEKRKAMNLSYQNVADACNVSQRTIIRLFKQEGDPSFSLMQKVISALEFEFVRTPVAPVNNSTEEYIQYLQNIIDFERKDKKIRLDQQEAKHNRYRNETRRIIMVVIGVLSILLFAICGLFVYDFAHLDRGWIQAVQSGYTTSASHNSILSALNSFGGSIWSV